MTTADRTLSSGALGGTCAATGKRRQKRKRGRIRRENFVVNGILMLAMTLCLVSHKAIL